MKNKEKKPQAARSLTATLAIAFLALSVVVLLISGGLQLFSNIQTQQATIAGQQQLIAQGAAGTVSSFIQEKFSVLETTVRLADPATASPEAQKQILGGLLGPQPAFRQLVLLNAQDQELAKTSRLSQAASGRLADQLQGDVLAQIRQGTRYIGPIYIDPLTSEPLVMMAVPATNALKEFQGTLVAEVNLKVDLWDLVDQLKVGETGLAYVVDWQGNLIAFSDIARVLKGENVGQLKTVSDFIHNPALVRTTGASTYQGIQGDTVVGTYVPLGTPDWAVITELPWQEAYQEVIRVAVASIGITLAMVILAGLTGVFVARRLAVPLVNLTGTATRIAGGEMGLQAVVAGPNEVASLATAFNSMTQQLRSFIGNLEQRVAERTRDLERRSVQLQAASEVGRAATSILETDQLIGQMVELIRARFDLYYVGLFLVDETREWAVLRAGTGQAGQTMLARRHRIRIGEGMIGWSITNAQARIALEAGADAVRLATTELPETRSEAALPLRTRGQVIGALTVQSAQPDAFDQIALAALQVMADQVAVALDNAHLFAESQATLEAMRRMYGEQSRQAWQQMVQTRSLRYLCTSQSIYPIGGQWEPEMVRARKTGQPAQDGSSLAVPIKVRDQILGAMRLRKSDPTAEWTAEETALLQTLTEQLGVALESARLYQDTQHRAAQERLTSEVSARMRESLDLDSVLRTTTEEMHRVFNLAEAELHIGFTPGEEQPSFRPAQPSATSA